MAAAADSKRLSLGGRVATPRVGSPASSMSIETALARCIGAKIRIQTAGPNPKKIEGHIFSASPSSPFLTLTPTPFPPPSPAAPTQAAPPPTAYTVLPLSSIQTFTLLELAPPSTSTNTSGPSTPTSPIARFPSAAVASLPAVDAAAVQKRLATTVAKLQAEEARRGKGVTAEAQGVYDAMAKTLPCRWDGERIIVSDAVVIEPPYGPANIRPGEAASRGAVPHIKKILEAEKKKMDSNARGQKSGAGEKKGG